MRHHHLEDTMSARPTRRRAAIATVGLMAFSLAVAACSGTANDTKGPGGDAKAAYALSTSTPSPSGDVDQVTWSLYAEPFSLAYPYAFDYPPNTVLSNVCESLLRWNADLTISP